MNIEHGKIDFPCNLRGDVFEDTADILGIYGQNGSGKSAFVRLMALLGYLLKGESIPPGSEEFISVHKDTMSCSFEFALSDEASHYRVFYSFTIEKKKNAQNNDDASSAFVSSEYIGYKTLSDNKWSKKKTLIETKFINEETIKIGPQKSIACAFGIPVKQIDPKLDAFAILAATRSTSFLFSKPIISLIKHNPSLNSSLYFEKILMALRSFSLHAFYIIDSQEIGLINLNIILPLRMRTGTSGAIDKMGLILDKAGSIPESAFNLACDCINNINTVLSALIPGMRLKLKEIGRELSRENEKLITAELQSIRQGYEIPLRYESDGIKKIIAVLSTLIAVYSSPSMTVVIDEFDSGIFEYLLGEILTVLKRSGRGQLIFTSHNLRPLEVLNKNDIIFTTSNKMNRYIRLKNVKRNNNLRDVYYRTILLSGQTEELYEQTNDFLIEKAFRSVDEILEAPQDGKN